MVQPTFQREWVERRGLLLVLAFFLGGLGGGLYLVSLYFGFYPGLITAFLIVAIGKSSAHLIDLGRPWRSWRAFFRPQTSWMSRGLIALAIFLIFSGLQLAPTIPLFSWLPWSDTSPVIIALAALGAVILIGYSGFVLGVVSAIPFWNSALIPLIFIVYALLGGAGLTLGILSIVGERTISIVEVEAIIRFLLVIAVLVVGTHLWGTYHTGSTGKRSVVELIRGGISRYFIGGVVLLGILIPMSVVGYTLFNSVPPWVLTATAACVLVGGFFLSYSVLKAGIYAPII
jgi:formate-dependent nitrite reductase membrane component NrfD